MALLFYSVTVPQNEEALTILEEKTFPDELLALRSDAALAEKNLEDYKSANKE